MIAGLKMNMPSNLTFEVDRLKNHKSLLADLNPQLKVVMSLIAVVATVTVNSLNILLLILAGVPAFLIITKAPIRKVLTRTLWGLPFGVAIALTIPFNVPGNPWLEQSFLGFRLVATYEGIERGLVAMLRLWISLLILSAATSTTPPNEIVKALRTLGFPSQLTQILDFCLRYVFLLGDELQRLERAAKSRAFQARGVVYELIMKTKGQLIGALLLRSLARSERIFYAMLARGLGASQATTKENQGRSVVSADKLKGANCCQAEPVINVDGLCYRYPDGTVALRDISFVISRSSKVAILGHNGAGKSTLLLHLNGILRPQKGTVEILGQKVSRETESWVRSRVGLVFQDPDDQLFCPTVIDDVMFGPLNLGLTKTEAFYKAKAAIDGVRLGGLESRPPHLLSYGQKRRAAIAGVLAMDPEIVLFDEPMAFLDPQGKQSLVSIMKHLHEQGKTLIVATHDVDFALQWATYVIVITSGQLIAKGSPDVLLDVDLLEKASLACSTMGVI